jgi:hypothetical protein
MKGIHWIDLGQWPPALAVTGDKRAYNRLMRDRQCPNPQPFPRPRHGLCQHMENEEGETLFVIALGEYADKIEQAAALAHEATHAMRWILEEAGEKEPGTETQAYLVEHIVAHGLKALTP